MCDNNGKDTIFGACPHPFVKTSFLAQSRKKIEIAPEFYDKVGAILLLSYQQKNHNVLDIKQKSVFLRKILNIIKMKRPLLPKQERMLRGMGDNLRLARLRRDLSSEQVAERAGISRNTLIKIEKGDEGVAIGMYFRVLIVLGLQDDLSLIARDDVLGRKLQDIGLTTPRRASKRPPLNN